MLQRGLRSLEPDGLEDLYGQHTSLIDQAILSVPNEAGDIWADAVPPVSARWRWPRILFEYQP